MAGKELRHMNRGELIDVIYALKKQQEELAAENKELRQQLSQRELKLQQAGSIAEAAMALNQVFEAAQQAADQYLQSVYANCGDAEIMAKEILADANARAQNTLEEACRQSEAMLSKAKAEKDWTQQECQALRQKTEEETKARWEAFERRVGDLFMSYQNNQPK